MVFDMAASVALVLFMGDSSFTGDAPFGNMLRGGTRGCSCQGIGMKGAGEAPRFVVKSESIGQAGEDLSL